MVSFVLVLVLVALRVEVVVVVVGVEEEEEEEIASRFVLADRAVSPPVGSALVLAGADILYAPTQSATSS